MGPRITWTRFADGTWLCDQHPVRIPSRPDRTLPVCVEVPVGRDAAFDDGWHWHTIESRPDRELLVLGSISAAKVWVESNLAWALEHIAADYDGDPVGSTAARAAKIVRIRGEYETKRPADMPDVADQGVRRGKQRPTAVTSVDHEQVARTLSKSTSCQFRFDSGALCGQPGVAVRAVTVAGRNTGVPVCVDHCADGEMVLLREMVSPFGVMGHLARLR